jgi:saccharopine dehydrogenase-like NADP-dependent oxidoreductase
MKIIVLGGGLVGGPIAIDLTNENGFEVTVADYSSAILDKLKSKCPELHVTKRDLSNPNEVTKLVGNYDLVINAVPGFMGFNTAKAIIKAGKSCAVYITSQIPNAA